MKISRNFLMIFLTYIILPKCSAWEHLPQIPTGRRSQYLLIENNGGYKYGYDTGSGLSAKQSGSPDNQVEGHYFYTAPSGQKVDLRYTSGVQGFVPEGLEAVQNTLGTEFSQRTSLPDQTYSQDTYSAETSDDQSNTGDASYEFTIDTDSYKRTESSDASGNVRGSYSYKNADGNHDISYVAGSGTGFMATSGSLSLPNGLPESVNAKTSYAPPIQSYNAFNSIPIDTNSKNDGSYSFKYSTDDSSREESSDANGNVKGRYSFKNEAGKHDLSYVAGSGTGFVATGGSLSLPNNGVDGSHSASFKTSTPLLAKSQADIYSTGVNDDGSYSFSYVTGDSSRQESADKSGNVQGRYTFQNEAGTHDLNYVAGSDTGFLTTGGSLALPNGLSEKSSANFRISPSTNIFDSKPPFQHANAQIYDSNNDGTYSFSYSTGDSSREESSDKNGNVRGRYSYNNEAGNHDLSYIAGSDTGFVAVGGSLAGPNGVTGSAITSLPSVVPLVKSSSSTENGGSADDLSNTGDASYSFNIDTDTYKRQESSDASGNVKGYYSYLNSAGNHDLSYVAGSDTGFVATSGSLKDAPGLSELQLKSGEMQSAGSSSVITKSSFAPSEYSENNSEDDLANTGDSSYAFSIDTDTYTRQESSDASGNVKGSYSYKNSAGSHDLQYVAGSNTGFLATAGSLKTPPGLTDSQLKLGESLEYRAHDGHFMQPYMSLTPSSKIAVLPNDHINGKISYLLDNLAVKAYLPPSNDKQKFGYVFDSQ